MSEVVFCGRRAVQAENETVRVTATVEGGHIAEILHKPSGVNPLWIPPWPSVEPSRYSPAEYPEYGGHSEAHLLAGIMGHNVCLDTFGAPSPEEAAAGMPVHGEAPVAGYAVSSTGNSIVLETSLPKAQLWFQRSIRVPGNGGLVEISETLENLTAFDRPIAWTQHVTLGPPFLESGLTQFRISGRRSMVIDSDFNSGKGRQRKGAQFDWPACPRVDGGVDDLGTFTDEPVSGGFTAHLMDPERTDAYFLAWSPRTRVLFGYMWNRSDFPWLARWEENHLRTGAPWNGNGLACGMEFGVSPMVESRREMVARGSLFGVPTFRWIPAKTKIEVRYCAFVTVADSMPAAIKRTRDGGIALEPGKDGPRSDRIPVTLPEG